MPGFNWRESQGQILVPGQATGGREAADGGSWRTRLPPGSRHRIVDKILETLKKHLPFSEEEGSQDLEDTALRFEESIFTTATSQSDYLRKISLKMLGIETKYQSLRMNSRQTNAGSTSRNSQDPEAAASLEVSDWRSHLHSNSRTRIVNKIVETLKRHLPFSGLEGALEIESIAVRFEEKIYSAATSQSDYLRKISLKMLTLETRSQNSVANTLLFSGASDGGNSEDPDETSLLSGSS